MPEIRDQSNKRIIRNYVEMPDRPVFSSLEVVSATAVCFNTVIHELKLLEQEGVLIRTAKRRKRRVYYRRATSEEQDAKTLAKTLKVKPVSEVAKELGISEEAVYQRIRKMDTWPEIAKAKVKRPISKANQELLNSLTSGSRYSQAELEAKGITWDKLQYLHQKGYLVKKDGAYGKS